MSSEEYDQAYEKYQLKVRRNYTTDAILDTLLEIKVDETLRHSVHKITMVDMADILCAEIHERIANGGSEYS